MGIGLASDTIGGGFKTRISGEGSLFVEEGGETGIIRQYIEHPEKFIININQNTNIHGNVSQSNIASHSSNVSQRIKSNPEMQNLILQIIETLQKDTSINHSVREDLINDIETLKIQLAKNTKNKNLLEAILNNLSNITSISSFVMQLSPYVASFFK